MNPDEKDKLNQIIDLDLNPYYMSYTIHPNNLSFDPTKDFKIDNHNLSIHAHIPEYVRIHNLNKIPKLTFPLFLDHILVQIKYNHFSNYLYYLTNCGIPVVRILLIPNAYNEAKILINQIESYPYFISWLI